MISLYSSRWHRVAALKPRLTPQSRRHRQRLRGATWMVLTHPQGGRSVRLNAPAYAFAGRLDGRRTMQQIWEALLAADLDPPSQDELIDILARLREASLVHLDAPADFDLLLPHLSTSARPKGRGHLLAWRVPLSNPSKLLDRLQWLQPLMFSPAALMAWSLAMANLLVISAQHAPTLWAHGLQWIATPRYALLAMLLYVPVKLLHELAHGLAVRHWGGQVREAGVTLMLLMPVPYVDASAASGFVQRRHRMTVSAAGVMTELALAAAALPLWLWLDDGLAKDAAFVTLFITGISTVLFNANPLQRLDGYYLLTDALALPNLAPRSREWWLDLLQRRLLVVSGADAMPVAPGEAPWLAVYAPLAWLYGLFIAALAALWLGQLSVVLGTVCGALLTWQMLLRPAWRLLRQLRRTALSKSGPARRWRFLCWGGSAVLTLALLVPLPQRTLVQGVVWPSDKAQLRADEEGFVEAVHIQDGQPVSEGDLVLQLTNPKLEHALTQQTARVAALENELIHAMPMAGRPDADARPGDAQARLAAAQAELQRLSQRVAALSVRAHSSGRLALPEAADLAQRFVRKGSLLGQVVGEQPLTVRVALPESQASDLLAAQRVASVRLAASLGTAHDATLVRDGIGAVMQLPSAALSSKHGGTIQTDPGDTSDLKPLAPVVLLDVRLQPPSEVSGGIHGAQTDVARHGERIGERAWIRFDTGLVPSAWQWIQALKRNVMRRFNPQF